jgi:hypothetical protein
VLLMAFWLVPLVAKLGYATSINWKWYFQSWRDLLPKMFYPVLALAVLDLLWVAIRRRPEDRPARYLFACIILTAVCFFNATEVGLPEIRFVPLTYCCCSCWRWISPRAWCRCGWPRTWARWRWSRACSGGCIRTRASCPSWIRWNYEGLQKKPTWASSSG